MFYILGGSAVVGISFWTTLWAMDRAVSSYDENTDRVGANFRMIEMNPGGNARSCESQCRLDLDCGVWVFIKVSPAQKNPLCLLKSSAAEPTPNPTTISGEVRRSWRTFF